MTRDLNAILTVLARGYNVTITINGIDIGVRGGKSESIKLFSQGSPMVSALPEDMKNQVCLQEGENLLFASYERLDDTASNELTIELVAREQLVNGANLIYRKEKGDLGKKKSFEDTFSL